jgi:hypothetical protein
MAYEISEIKSEVLFSISIVTYCKVFNTSNDSSLCLYSEEVNMTTRVSLILLQILKKICTILLRYNCYHKESN